MTLHTRLENICGATPLIKVSDRVYGKLETYNPTGSIKDRMITYIVKNALLTGAITVDTVLCEATSGNTGVSLSAMAASLGLKCVIFMPCNMSVERKQMMTVYGAVLVEALEDNFEDAIRLRDEFLSDNVNAWSPMQFSNTENIECHMSETAPEIAKQAGPGWVSFIHGSGTGGTIEGVRRFIEAEGLGVEVHMVVPKESPHGIQGIGDGQDFLADPKLVDGIIRIATAKAIQRAESFAKETGILVGISAGANILASERWVMENDPAGIVVTILCDRGERYMSIYGKD